MGLEGGERLRGGGSDFGSDNAVAQHCNVGGIGICHQGAYYAVQGQEGVGALGLRGVGCDDCDVGVGRGGARAGALRLRGGGGWSRKGRKKKTQKRGTRAGTKRWV